MKFWKYTLVASVAIMGISATMFSASCSKDSCESLQCKNGGTCAAGFCSCPTGYEGAECETKVTARYIGTYAGGTLPANGQPYHLDTVDVYVTAEPYTLSAVRRERPDEVFTGTLEPENNTIAVDDVVNGSSKKVITLTLKPTTSQSKVMQCNLTIKEWIDGKYGSEVRFDGVKN
jgi:hypothetical protein